MRHWLGWIGAALMLVGVTGAMAQAPECEQMVARVLGNQAA